jgi:hypothetical protein
VTDVAGRGAHDRQPARPEHAPRASPGEPCSGTTREHGEPARRSKSARCSLACLPACLWTREASSCARDVRAALDRSTGYGQCSGGQLDGPSLRCCCLGHTTNLETATCRAACDASEAIRQPANSKILKIKSESSRLRSETWSAARRTSPCGRKEERHPSPQRRQRDGAAARPGRGKGPKPASLSSANPIHLAATSAAPAALTPSSSTRRCRDTRWARACITSGLHYIRGAPRRRAHSAPEGPSQCREALARGSLLCDLWRFSTSTSSCLHGWPRQSPQGKSSM